MSTQGKDEAKEGGVPARTNLYARTAKHAVKAINVLVGLLESKNEAVKMGAAKVLLSKALPDLRAVELTGQENGPVKISIIYPEKDNGDRITDKELPETTVDL